MVVVTVDGNCEAFIALADQLRTDAAEAIAALASTLTHPPVLSTGDNPDAARAVAAQVGVNDVRAALLPQDKVAAVRALETRDRRVALVGDGINDAPAMAAAHVGVAMGRRGSDLALDTADVVIVRDDLTAIAKVIDLSRHARRVVVANLAIAAAVITALVTWDLAGHLPLPLGVAGHEGSTVIVGLNGLRLLRAAAWRRSGAAS